MVNGRKLGAVAALGALALTACGGGEAQTDGPVELKMWARASTSALTTALVEEFNANHENQVDLTVIPGEEYLQRVGVAAGSGDLPCLMASDVVYAPNFIESGMLHDITQELEALPYYEELAKGHIDATTVDEKHYAMPHGLSLSVLMQNDVLIEKAGIDPDAPVETLDDLIENAKIISDEIPSSTGLYYTGNHGGSISFTHLPAVWASGGEFISEDGTEAFFDSPEVVGVFEKFNESYQNGSTDQNVSTETGATRNDLFGEGNIAYMLTGSNVLGTIPETEDLRIGIKPVPGLNGGKSSFMGGDVLGISANCENVDAAWEFLEWTQEEETQVEVYSKNEQIPTRADMSANKYSEEDERLVEINSYVAIAKTPYSLNYAQTFNDPSGPALGAFHDGLYGDDPEKSLKDANEAITDSLSGN